MFYSIHIQPHLLSITLSYFQHIHTYNKKFFPYSYIHRGILWFQKQVPKYRRPRISKYECPFFSLKHPSVIHYYSHILQQIIGAPFSNEQDPDDSFYKILEGYLKVGSTECKTELSVLVCGRVFLSAKSPRCEIVLKFQINYLNSKEACYLLIFIFMNSVKSIHG